MFYMSVAATYRPLQAHDELALAVADAGQDGFGHRPFVGSPHGSAFIGKPCLVADPVGPTHLHTAFEQPSALTACDFQPTSVAARKSMHPVCSKARTASCQPHVRSLIRYFVDDGGPAPDPSMQVEQTSSSDFTVALQLSRVLAGILES